MTCIRNMTKEKTVMAREIGHDTEEPPIMKTVADLAAKAFMASERVHTLMIMNTPTDYEDRKKAFIELALAREVAAKALIALALASSRGW